MRLGLSTPLEQKVTLSPDTVGNVLSTEVEQRPMDVGHQLASPSCTPPKRRLSSCTNASVRLSTPAAAGA